VIYLGRPSNEVTMGSSRPIRQGRLKNMFGIWRLQESLGLERHMEEANRMKRMVGSQRLNLWNYTGKMSPASAKSWLLGVDGRAQMSLLQRRRSGFGKQWLLSTKCYNHQSIISL